MLKNGLTKAKSHPWQMLCSFALYVYGVLFFYYDTLTFFFVFSYSILTLVIRYFTHAMSLECRLWQNPIECRAE